MNDSSYKVGSRTNPSISSSHYLVDVVHRRLFRSARKERDRLRSCLIAVRAAAEKMNDNKHNKVAKMSKQQLWEDPTPTESTEDSTIIQEYASAEEDTSLSTTITEEESSSFSSEQTSSESSYNTLSRTSCSDDDSETTIPSHYSGAALDAAEETPATTTTTAAPKTIPAPTQSYKVTCLSFLDDSIPTAVASRVFDEALRILEPNGLLYVVDRPNGCVPKCPKMRQLLFRVRGAPTPAHEQHDRETRAILQTNGFAAAQDGPVVRWMGIKP